MDYASADRYKTRLQAATDTAVLASARELTLGNTDMTALQAVATNYFMAAAGPMADGAIIKLTGEGKKGKITLEFSRLLFTVTHIDTPVILANDHSDPASVAHPGLV